MNGLKLKRIKRIKSSLFLALMRRTNVPLSSLFHNDSPAYIAEGFGGKPLQNWPVFKFYKTWLEGNHTHAKRDFENWYECTFLKWMHTPKSEGGMYKGSLYRLIETRHRQQGYDFKPENKNGINREIFVEAIQERVTQRLDLLENISTNGFQTAQTDKILAIKQTDNCIVLQGGHHRASALLALGYNEMPELYIFPSRRLFIIYKMFRRS